jgi:uncharacterized protein YeaO (DUF488 family)
VFYRAYRREMVQPDNAHAIELLARLSHSTNFSVGCYCEDEAFCHRSMLRTLLQEQGAHIAVPAAESAGTPGRAASA